MPYSVKQYSEAKELNYICSLPLAPGSSYSLQLSWKHFDNIFESREQDEKYVVTLTSNKGKTVYKLYSSKQKNKSNDALQSIAKLLSPLASVYLTQDLLVSLLLPVPKPLDDLPYLLCQYIMKLSPANEEWKKLVKLTVNNIPITYCICEMTNMSLLRDIYESAKVNIVSITHPVTGSTLVHLSTQLNDESLREVIHYLHKATGDNENEFIEYVNKPAPYDSFIITPSPLVRRVQSLFTVNDTPLLTVDKILRRVEVYPFELGSVTPLMLAVRKNCVRSVHYLLVAGADPNYQDPVKGMTALHIAAIICNVSIMKLLLSFNGDLTLKDGEDKTPIDVVKEREGEKAEECLLVMEKVQQMRESVDIRDIGDIQVTSTSDGVSLLSIDGGGTRGVVCSFILYYIEKRMKLLSGDPNLQIRYYFNWYAATSIGSLMTLCMTHNDCNTRTVMEAIVNNRHHVLAGRRVYDGPTQDYFGQLLIGPSDFRSISIPKVLVTTSRADRDPPKLILITNYRSDPGDNREWKAWQAARASSAAPLFFPSFEQKYVDGGILATNPTQHALHDIHVYDQRKVSFILSLGTGIAPAGTNESIDLVKPRLTHLLTDLQRDLKFLKSLKGMLTANIVNCEDTVLHSKCWCESQGGVYHRLSPPLTQRLELDEKSDDGFVLFFYETYLYLLEIDSNINSIATFLVQQGPKYTRKQFKSTWV